MKLSRFAGFSWGVLAYTLAVVLWGAYVRISYSGDGCGDHWPLCKGEIIPTAASVKTLIEFSHRATSGMLGLLVLAMAIWALRAFPKGHLVRVGAGIAFLFIIIESLLGAGLVKFGLVNKNDSVQRAVVMSLHLINTLTLIAATALTAWWASGGQPLRMRTQKGLTLALAGGLVAMLVLGVSGAITALGDTLFPASSLSEGIAQDFSPTAHVLLRLRIWHPVIALAVSAYLVFITVTVSLTRADRITVKLSRGLIALIVAQISFGFLNLYLLAPTWMQLVHLLTADTVWVTLVLFSASALAAEARVGEFQPAVSGSQLPQIET